MKYTECEIISKETFKSVTERILKEVEKNTYVHFSAQKLIRNTLDILLHTKHRVFKICKADLKTVKNYINFALQNYKSIEKFIKEFTGFFNLYLKEAYENDISLKENVEVLIEYLYTCEENTENLIEYLSILFATIKKLLKRNEKVSRINVRWKVEIDRKIKEKAEKLI